MDEDIKDIKIVIGKMIMTMELLSARIDTMQAVLMDHKAHIEVLEKVTARLMAQDRERARHINLASLN